VISNNSKEERKLLIVPSKTFAIYMIAYIKEFELESKFDVYLDKGGIFPDYLIHEFKLLNCNIISKELAFKNSYSELVIHSFASFENQLETLDAISFEKLTLYSDGFRNGILHFLPAGVLISKLIYFGFILSEDTLEYKLGDSSKTILREVVSFKSIQDTWKRILRGNAINFRQVFDKGDLLIVMRYWGDENFLYQFKDSKSILDYITAEIETVSYERIILKSHPWFNLSFDASSLESALGKKVITWENLFSTDVEHSELVSPEALMWALDESPDYIFAFDSSLNILAAQNWKSTKVIYPSRTLYENYFKNTLSTDFVSEQLDWISEVINWITNRPGSTFQLSTDGRLIEMFLQSMVLHEYRLKLVSLGDALTQERDALTQERDALTQERDALTQERDALVNSTIWRLTGFLRAVVSKIKGV